MRSTASHRSDRDGLRWYHHMMVLTRMMVGKRTRFGVFDVTMLGGVDFTRHARSSMVDYVRRRISSNSAFEFDPGTTQLHCFSVFPEG